MEQSPALGTLIEQGTSEVEMWSVILAVGLSWGAEFEPARNAVIVPEPTMQATAMTPGPRSLWLKTSFSEKIERRRRASRVAMWTGVGMMGVAAGTLALPGGYFYASIIGSAGALVTAGGALGEATAMAKGGERALLGLQWAMFGTGLGVATSASWLLFVGGPYASITTGFVGAGVMVLSAIILPISNGLVLRRHREEHDLTVMVLPSSRGMQLVGRF